jgi:DNA repair protein RadA/Sms
VSRIEQRIGEAEKLGFETVYLSKFNKLPAHNFKIKLVEITKLDELLNLLFG